MLETLQLPFMQRAFLLGAVAAVPFGLIGTFVVVRRIGYLAGAIAHCALGGIGIGLFLQYILLTVCASCGAAVLLGHCLNPTVVPLAVAVAAALLIGFVHLRTGEREDTIIGAIWSVGMALGLLLFELTPGSVNISNYLFGNILLITPSDVALVCFLCFVVLLTVMLFFKRLEAVCFDEEFSRIRGVSSTFYFQLLLVLTALTVVLLVKVVGIILVIAMLTLPAASASKLANRLLPICLYSIVICFLCTWTGLLISVYFNLPSGPSIVLTAVAVYLGTFLFKRRS
ncbi:MAG: metal ABC transporter permease [Planctomycetaceae bacterium]|nr:metal ABC transporter permease [Planctomycetaceae bacterium]